MKSDIYQKFIFDLIKTKPKSEEDILYLKRKWSKKNSLKLLSNSELLACYRELLKSKKIKININLEQLLKKRQVRTNSGVAPVAVLTKPYKCPGKCVYCPTQKNMPKSYLSNEPAVMRAMLCKFDPFKQVVMRIQALENNGHDTDKIELIVMGGTWDYLPEKYRLWFIYECFRGANSICHSVEKRNPENSDTGSRVVARDDTKRSSACQPLAGMTNSNITMQDLYREQKKNETAKHRIVGLTLETRPDYVTEKSVLEMRELGATRVELGVQHIDDKILKLNKRGATTADTIRATKLLRDFGFKITYHLMPNLPGSNIKKDFLMFQKIFSDPDFQPDQIKIYPCVVTKEAQIYKWFKTKKYKAYTEKQLRNLLTKIKSIVPYYVRIIRVIRDIPEESIVAGNKITNLRHLLNAKCKCIRCREVGHISKCQMSNVKCQNKYNKRQTTKLFIQKYQAGGFTEYFLSFESKNRKILYAFCRLRLPLKKYSHSNSPKFVSLLASLPMIRELHSYGQMVAIGDKIKSASQHKGFGKQLLAKAEKIARQKGFKEIAVIAGIGVREYYKKLGYLELRQTYLIKKI